MKRSDYIALSRAEARKVMTAGDHSKVIEAITSKEYILFHYKDDEGKRKIYRGVQPIEFFVTPGWRGDHVIGEVYLWAYHLLDQHKHSFWARTITEVDYWPTIITAILNPDKYRYFWEGKTVGIETIEL